MPLIYFEHINETTRLGVWEITENEPFFSLHVHSNPAITHPQKRLQYLAGRYLLQVVEPAIGLSKSWMETGSKPFDDHQNFQFSISHSGTMVVVVVANSKTPVGVDVEPVAAKPFLVREKFISLSEAALLNTEQNASLAYTIAWCAKEAVYKLLNQKPLSLKANLQIRGVDWGLQTVAVHLIKAGLDEPFEVRYFFFNNWVVAWV